MQYSGSRVLCDAPAALQAWTADLFSHLQLHVCFAHMKNSWRPTLLETDYTGASSEGGSRSQYPILFVYLPVDITDRLKLVLIIAGLG